MNGTTDGIPNPSWTITDPPRLPKRCESGWVDKETKRCPFCGADPNEACKKKITP